jgi:hypothetical protein
VDANCAGAQTCAGVVTLSTRALVWLELALVVVIGVSTGSGACVFMLAPGLRGEAGMNSVERPRVTISSSTEAPLVVLQ